VFGQQFIIISALANVLKKWVFTNLEGTKS